MYESVAYEKKKENRNEDIEKFILLKVLKYIFLFLFNKKWKATCLWESRFYTEWEFWTRITFSENHFLFGSLLFFLLFPNLLSLFIHFTLLFNHEQSIFSLYASVIIEEIVNLALWNLLMSGSFITHQFSLCFFDLSIVFRKYLLKFFSFFLLFFL